MEIKENYPLKKLTTIQVGGPARFFVAVKSVAEVKEAVDWAKEKGLDIFVLSGGSNVVVSDKGFDGLVISINILGFDKVKEDEKNVWIKVGAGEVLDRVVERMVKNSWWGVENLSWIPGKVGACVVQNSGAYGQELGEVVESVEIFDWGGGIKEISKDECKFGYRSSVFNNEWKDKLIILSATLKLARQSEAKIDYPDVKEYFKNKGVDKPGLKDIRQAIIYIRDNKLPKLDKVGSAGSFFKNLVLSSSEFEELLVNLKKNFGQEYVAKALELKNKFKVESGIKIPTAWLIEICGLKGAEVGHVKVYEKQPLVLITELGKATADEVLGLFSKVRREVYNKTGMKLEPEPRMVGFSSEEVEGYFKLA